MINGHKIQKKKFKITTRPVVDFDICSYMYIYMVQTLYPRALKWCNFCSKWTSGRKTMLLTRILHKEIIRPRCFLAYCTSSSLFLSEGGQINLNKQPYTWYRLNTVRYPRTILRIVTSLNTVVLIPYHGFIISDIKLFCNIYLKYENIDSKITFY